MHPSLGASALALALCLPTLALAAPSVDSGPSLQLARKNHTAVRLRDGRVLIVGGLTSEARGPGAEVFDPRTKRFRAVDNTEDRFRGYVSAALLRDGRVFVSSLLGSVNQAWLFDPQSNRVSRAADLGFRYWHTASRMRDGRILISGGSQRLEAYDPRTDSTSRIGGSSAHYAYPTHTSTPLRGGEVVLLTGGKFIDKLKTHSRGRTQLVRANGVNGTSKLKVKRYDHAAVSVGYTQALIVGGRRSRSWFRSHEPVGSLELFDLPTETFTKIDSLAIPRWGCAVVRDGVDVLITGGANRADELSTVEVYSIRSKRVTAERFRLRSKRAFHTATRLRDGSILVVGGEANGARLRSSELIKR